MPLPPEGILQAAACWLSLLPRSPVAQASALLHSDARYLRLSSTQYAGALEWLINIGVVVSDEKGLRLDPRLEGIGVAELCDAAFRAGLQADAPAWLQDADLYVQDTSDLPADAATLSASLELSPNDAIAAIRQVHGKIDLEARSRVGGSGELAVVATLNQAWRDAARHVALDSDGLGYDIAVTVSEVTWHLEIKSTTRRGRLVVYLSRQEFEIGQLDPRWRLVVAGLGDDDDLAGLATVRSAVLWERAPNDHDVASRWETARYELGPTDLEPGLSFLSPVPSDAPLQVRVLLEAGSKSEDHFAWMPSG